MNPSQHSLSGVLVVEADSPPSSSSSSSAPTLAVTVATASHTPIAGVVFYELTVRTEVQSWRLLRRYTWFAVLSASLVSDGVALTAPVPVPTFWENAWDQFTDQAQRLRERAELLQKFVNEVLEKNLHREKEYVELFFLPVRRLTKHPYDSAKAFGLQSLSRLHAFVDGETLYPSVTSYQPLASITDYFGWDHVPEAELTAVPSDRERIELRAVLTAIQRLKESGPAENAVRTALQHRLRLLNQQAQAEMLAKDAADEEKKSMLRQTEEEVVVKSTVDREEEMEEVDFM